MLHPAALQDLRTFRSELYGCFVRRADAQFEVVDALLAADALPSLPYLSLVALHRRGWGSVYAALSQGWLDPDAVRAAVARHPLVGGRRIYAVDVSVWPRCDAEASPERGFS